MKLAKQAVPSIAKESIKKSFIPLDIQFFAGEGATGTCATGTEGAGEEGGGAEEVKTLDDLLKSDKNYQSEFDKRITKAIATAQAKWETTKATELEAAKSEAEKLAKMTADEKVKFEQEKKEADFNKRYKDLTTRELKAEAYGVMAEKGLPKELVDVLNYESADTVKASMEAVSTAFQSAVEKAVNEKLRGTGAPKGSGAETNTLQAQIAAAMRA